VRSFEEIKNPRTKHGHGSPGSWKAVIVGCLKETEKILFSPNIERSRASDEEEKRGDRRGKVFTRRDDDETVVTQRARFPAILAVASSTSVNARVEFVHRDVSAAINIRRCVALKTRPKELERSNFLG